MLCPDWQTYRSTKQQAVSDMQCLGYTAVVIVAGQPSKTPLQLLYQASMQTTRLHLVRSSLGLLGWTPDTPEAAGMQDCKTAWDLRLHKLRTAMLCTACRHQVSNLLHCRLWLFWH